MITIINQNLTIADFEKIKVMVKEKNNTESYLLVQITNLSQKSRWLVRRAINRNPNAKVILFSENITVGHFAWQIGAFYFSTYPLQEVALQALHQRIESVAPTTRRLRLNYKGGFKLVHPLSISVIRGQGNYCQFYFKDEQPQLYTVRIHDMDRKLSAVPYLCRINKSLIININNLSKIEKGYAFFGGKPATQLKLNTKTLALIKKKLLWLDQNDG
jgi:DNA-binding LytR/AlgR family response regulator